jgi:hypothetical protein
MRFDVPLAAVSAVALAATALALAALPPAAQAAEFAASAGPNFANNGIGGDCTPGPTQSDGPLPAHVSITCGGALGVGSAAATSSFGHIGASARVATLTSVTQPAAFDANAFLRDSVVFSSTDPTATIANVSVNLLLDGVLNAAGVAGFSGGDAELDGDVRLGNTFFRFHYRVFSDGTSEASNPMQVQGNVLGPNFNASFHTPTVQVLLNSPTLFELQMIAFAECGGIDGSASSDFGGSFKLPTGSDAFNLQDGVRVNGVDGGWLVNNRFHDPLAASAGGVPEPAAWALLITGFGLTGGAFRRRRSQPA